jgi:hypothetical protein
MGAARADDHRAGGSVGRLTARCDLALSVVTLASIFRDLGVTGCGLGRLPFQSLAVPDGPAVAPGG